MVFEAHQKIFNVDLDSKDFAKITITSSSRQLEGQWIDEVTVVVLWKKLALDPTVSQYRSD